MNYVGKRVRHEKYGYGIITVQTTDKIEVKFDKVEQKKIFLFPSSLETHLELLEDKIMLLSVLEKHGFEGFHHYTNFSNFLQIMKAKKLYSRAEAEKKGVLFKDAAENAVIQKTDSFVKEKVRFYYKEDTPTLYRNEGIRHEDDFQEDEHNAHMPIPVLLLFDKELIFDRDVYISNGGCGSIHSIRTNDCAKAILFDWDEIFRRGVYGSASPEEGRIIKNKRNAEFLYPKAVGLDRLKAIVFRCEADKKHAEFLLGENELFQVNPNKFTIKRSENRKRNFLKNYLVIESGERRDVEFDFFNSPSEYNHKVKKYLKNGQIFEKIIDGACADGCCIRFSYNMEANIKYMEYLLNNEVSAIWR